VTGPADMAAAVETVGLPLVLKARSLGYDGRGIAVVRSRPDLEPAWDRLGRVQVVAEALVAFDRELSALVVRGLDATEVAYPVVENMNADGMLRVTRAPAPRLPEEIADLAQDWALRIAREHDHVGVLALELFQCGDRLLANEIAPRVHNSGHWTIDAAETSQFANHLRAILGLPLGSTEETACAAMLNLVGEVPDAASVLLEGVHLHVYGKLPRPGRKVGHVTVTAQDSEVLGRRLAALHLDPLR
jgi:5-(carboxyamino)imidazole ribonucleotide synthase